MPVITGNANPIQGQTANPCYGQAMSALLTLLAMATLAAGQTANPCSGQAMSSLLAHPTDCRKYYRCDNMGQAEELTCAGGSNNSRI